MQVYKAALKIIYRRKVAILIYTFVFFGMILLLTNINDGQVENDFSQVSVNIGVKNEDKGIFGEKLVESLSINNEIQEVPDDDEKLLDEMYYRQIEYILRIPEDFSEKFEAGERTDLIYGTQIPGSNVAALAEAEIEQYIKTTGLYMDSGSSLLQALEFSVEDNKKEGKVRFLSESGNSGIETVYYYFNYQAYVYICIVMIGVGPLMIIFKKKDMDARNKCSSMSFGNRNLQIIFGSIAVVSFIYLLFIGMACVLYPDFMFSMKGLLSAVNSFLFIMLTLSITFMVCQLVKTDNELHMIGNVIGLGFSFLGGVFVSLDVMGEGVKQISKFLPSYWYVVANSAIQKIGISENKDQIYQSYFVMFGFMMTFLALGMLMNRVKAKSQ